jgi:hypothetical protein
MDDKEFWRRFNLRTSPFFDEPLGVEHPIELMVGRHDELARTLGGIAGSGSSRRAVIGANGVGKTTFVARVKAECARAGYAVAPAPVEVLGPGGTPGLLVRLVRHIAGALESETHGAAAFLARFGPLGEGADADPLAPLEGWDLFRALAAASGAAAEGTVVHLAVAPRRRWEEQEAAAAARAVRDLRDLLLTHGCHFLVEGETQLIGRIFGRDAQVRDTFSLPTVLLPLESDAVAEAITRRIEYLRLDPAAGVPPLAAGDAIHEAHAATRGDLGRAFRALDTAARRRFGTRSAAAGPVTPANVRSALRRP